MVKENRDPEKPSFFLSFDDGLSEFNDIIAPILLRKGVPATCFLNSAFIDNKDLFYRYKACLLLHEINLKSSNQQQVFKKWLSDKRFGDESPHRFLLNIDYSGRNLLDDLAGMLGYSFKAYLDEQKPYLTASRIESLIQKGFTFGSHSIDHPLFSAIPPDEQLRQVVESSRMITGKFNLPYTVFSFPFTDYNLQQNFFVNINKAVNFDLTFGCAGIKADFADNHIHRIPVEETVLSAKKRIKRDFLYYLLKKPFDKNTIKRAK